MFQLDRITVRQIWLMLINDWSRTMWARGRAYCTSQGLVAARKLLMGAPGNALAMSGGMDVVAGLMQCVCTTLRSDGDVNEQ